MTEYREELELREKFPSYILPKSTSTYPRSITSLDDSFSGIIWIYGERKSLRTLSKAISESLTMIIKLDDSEIDRLLKHPSLLVEVLRERGISEKDIKEMNRALLEYIEHEAKLKQVELNDDVKKL